MKSICLFSSYFIQNKIPFYIKFYLEELNRHFDELVFITNEKELDFPEIDYLKSQGIQIEMVVNEGLDFGMWYKSCLRLTWKNISKLVCLMIHVFCFQSLIVFFSGSMKMVWIIVD